MRTKLQREAAEVNHEAAPEHWTNHIEPTTAEGKASVYAPYCPEMLSEDSPEAAAILLAELYEEWREGNFDETLAKFHGLLNLIRHNPHFRPEAEAIQSMIEGEIVLNQFAAKVGAI